MAVTLRAVAAIVLSCTAAICSPGHVFDAVLHSESLVEQDPTPGTFSMLTELRRLVEIDASRFGPR